MRRIWIALLLLGCWCRFGQAQVVEVPFATGEYAPFTSAKLANQGLFTEIVTAVCREARIRPVYRFYPWARADKVVLDGEVFAAFPYARTEERKQLYDFSDPLYYVTMSIFYYDRNPRFAAGPPRFERIEDLKGYRFGGLRAIFYEKDLLAAGIDFQPQENVEQTLQMMKAGRIDLLIDEQSVGYTNVRNVLPDEAAHFRILDKPYGDRKVSGLLVSRRYPDSKALLARFNEGIKAVKASGEYDRILGKVRGVH